MANPSLQDKVKDLYQRIKDEFYLCRDDLKVSGQDYNSALLLGVLTQLNKGKMLLFGEYGVGKTTSAEYLNAVFNNLPLDLVKQVAIRGDPQKTEEKMIGRPDYGKLHGQKEEVVWQHFILVPPKIIDEFNRIPESNQSMILNGVDRGRWNYLNYSINTGRQPFFATCNYSDRGNNGLIPPMLDRFDVAVESKFSGVVNAISISDDYENKKDKQLSNLKVTEKALSVLNSRKPYKEIYNNLDHLTGEHAKFLKGQGFQTLNNNEKARIVKEIEKIKLDNDAQTYFAFLIAEINVSPKYGQKRSIDQNDTDDGLYLRAAFIGSGSRRADKTLKRYAQSLAWLQGKDKVNLDHITQIAPYVLWHRLKWTDEVASKFRDYNRDDPLDLYIAKQLLGEGTEEYPGVKKRFVESKQNYQTVMDLIKHQKINVALNKAEEYSAGGKGHPIFTDIIKDLK
ncbi:MAG: hypothetical protein QXG00_04900 [Candidatus Woesearchaeota archaeon]